MKNLLLVLILTFFTGTLLAQTATTPSGLGTVASPYLIAKLDNLYWITQDASRWSMVYKQTADIDASTTSTWDGGKGFLPIGNNLTTSIYFTGSYNGQSYTISNLFINRTNTGLNLTATVGLFGYAVNATITNVKLVNVNITGDSDYGSAYVGALTGCSQSTAISNCSSTGSVTSPMRWAALGGLIGTEQLGSSTTNCYSSCIVGGIGSNADVGGLVGQLWYSSTISSSYSTGTVSSINNVGGLIGAIDDVTSVSYDPSSILNCYSTSSVSGGSYGGGLVGYTGKTTTTVTNCYSTGSVSSGSSSRGGLIVGNSGTITNCFWDKTTTGQLSSYGGTGKTTTEMKTPSTFIAAGWSGSIWNMGDGLNSGYPYLDWQNPSGTPLTIDSLPSTSGLIASYLFNGNANDGSGNGNNGIVYTAALTSDRFGKSNKAYSFNGQTDYISSTQQITNPFPLSISLWFKTTTTNGGKLFGFGESQTGSSSNHDRNIYMTNSGKIYFGVWTGSYQVLKSANSYNDGTWHHVVGIISTQGLMLYIDNSLAVHEYSVTSAQTMTGYWRIGYDNLAFWPDEPTSRSFAGSIDDIYIYNRALSVSEISSLFTATGTTSVKNPLVETLRTFNLSQNYPNPFNPSTSISFILPSRSFVSLKVFDLIGREVAIIVSEEMSAGSYSRQWNAANMSSGIYFYRLQAGSFTETKKLILLK